MYVLFCIENCQKKIRHKPNFETVADMCRKLFFLSLPFSLLRSLSGWAWCLGIVTAAIALPPEGGCVCRKEGRVRETCHDVGIKIGGICTRGYFFLSGLVTASQFSLLSSRVSPASFVCSLSSSFFFLVSCATFRRVAFVWSLCARLSSTLPLLSSVFSLVLCLVSPISTFSFLS